MFISNLPGCENDSITVTVSPALQVYYIEQPELEILATV